MRRMGMLSKYSKCSEDSHQRGRQIERQSLRPIDNHADMFRYYCLSILDKHHHPDITFDQGMKILRMCTDELQRRLPIDFKGMTVKVVKKDGIQEVEWDMSKQVLSA